MNQPTHTKMLETDASRRASARTSMTLPSLTEATARLLMKRS
jgi:hypothetical protein